MLSNSSKNERKQMEVEQELAMSCECEECGTGIDCSSAVTFDFVVLVRQGNVPSNGTNVPIFIEENCLKCVREQCYLNVGVSTPCAQPATIPCKVCLNRYRYVGCIKYLANIPRAGGGFYCFSGCECIDRVRCFTCSNVCLPCPPQSGFIASGPTGTVIATQVITVNFVAVTVRVTLTLTSPCTTGAGLTEDDEQLTSCECHD